MVNQPAKKPPIAANTALPDADDDRPHWTLHEAHHPRITRALAWAAANPAAESDLNALLNQCKHGPHR